MAVIKLSNLKINFLNFSGERKGRQIIVLCQILKDKVGRTQLSGVSLPLTDEHGSSMI